MTKLAGTYDGRSKLKKVWPPDFSKLSEKEKFRFERRYKRRVKLASARPRWDKFMRLVQLVSVTCECNANQSMAYMRINSASTYSRTDIYRLVHELGPGETSFP